MTKGEDLSVEELTEMCTLLEKMLAMERTVWDRRLSTHLMSLCQLCNLKSGARRTTPVVASYDIKGARSVRVCLGGTYSKPTSDNPNYKSARHYWGMLVRRFFQQPREGQDVASV